MSALCKDCGMDTEPWPPRRGTQEHYIVRDELWQQAGMSPGKMRSDDLAITGGGTLCVGCIEQRLGRLLTINDFSPITLDLLKDCQNTPRLLSRAGIAFMAVANNPLPDHIVEQWTETTIKNALADQPIGKGLVEVHVDGDEVILVFKKKAMRFRAGPGLKALMAELRRDQVTFEGSIDLVAWEDEAA
jgi:hypothetical protein